VAFYLSKAWKLTLEVKGVLTLWEPTFNPGCSQYKGTEPLVITNDE